MLTDMLVGLGRVELFHTADRHRLCRSPRSTGTGKPGRSAARAFAPGCGAATTRRPGTPRAQQRSRSALDLLEARAQFDGPERAVHVRVAEHAGRIYLDLADEPGVRSRSDPTDGSVIGSPAGALPPAGRHAAAAAPAARRVDRSSSRSFLNLPSRNDFVLVVAWLLATLRSGGPYPLLAVSGEQGSAKTVLSKMLRGA